MTLDDHVWESTGTLVAVANVPWIGGGLKIAPDAVVDDGLLDVVVAGPFSKPGVVQDLPGHLRRASTSGTRRSRSTAAGRCSSSR